MNCWQHLQLQPTGDKRAIKRAYAILLKETRAEDDANAFQQLREAYEQALADSVYYELRGVESQNHTDVQIDQKNDEASTSSTNNGLPSNQPSDALEDTSLTHESNSSASPQELANHHWSNFTGYFSENFGDAEFQSVADLYQLAISIVQASDETTGVEALKKLVIDPRMSSAPTSHFIEHLLAHGFNQESSICIPVLAFVAANFEWDSPLHPLNAQGYEEFVSLSQKLMHASQFKWQRVGYVRVRGIWDALQANESAAIAEFERCVQSEDMFNFSLREFFEEQIALLLISPEEFPRELAMHCYRYFDWENNRIPNRELSQQQYHYLLARYEGIKQMSRIKERLVFEFQLPKPPLQSRKPMILFCMSILLILLCWIPSVSDLLKKIDLAFLPLLASVPLLLTMASFWRYLLEVLEYCVSFLLNRRIFNALIFPVLQKKHYSIAIFNLRLVRRMKSTIEEIEQFFPMALKFELSLVAIDFWRSRPSIPPIKPITYTIVGSCAASLGFIPLIETGAIYSLSGNTKLLVTVVSVSVSLCIAFAALYALKYAFYFIIKFTRGHVAPLVNAAYIIVASYLAQKFPCAFGRARFGLLKQPGLFFLALFVVIVWFKLFVDMGKP